MAKRRISPVEPEAVEPQMCTVELRLDILSQVPFFAGLPHEDLVQINRLFHEQGYESGETIYFMGDPALHLYVVAAGKVKLLRHTLKGQDVLLDILTLGELFGTLSTLGDEVYPDTAQAQTGVCVLRIGAEDFRRILVSYPDAALAVLDFVSERLKAAHETVRQLSAHSVERRIAATLLRLGEKLGERQDIGLLIQMPLGRNDLAEMTGTTQETASRVLSQFQKDGLIQTGRQWVAITDLGHLNAIATDESD